MFASEPINLIYDNIRKTTISSSDPFTGVIRLALVPSSGTGDDTVTTSTGLRRLIYHAGVFPIGGDVSWEYKTPITSGASKLTTVIPPANATSKTGVLHFNFKTQSMTDTSLRPNVATNGLLMLALPHHAQLLPKKVLLRGKHFDLTYHCIKGPLTPVVGSTWSYEEPLLAMDFDAPQPKWDDGVSQMILDQVDEDLNRVLPTRSENVYGFGKQVARLAQLVHITHRLNQTSGTQQASDLLDRGTLELQKFLGMFMSSNVSDALLFDSNMGGIVSTDGLYDKGEDFGNGRYNGMFTFSSSCLHFVQ
jgi:endo-1,3(4)-beta-glucanase